MNYFSKLVEPATVLPTNLSPYFLYLIYLYFTPLDVQFVRRKIDPIGGDTVQPVDKNVAATFLVECVPRSPTLMPRHSKSDWWVCRTSLNILLKHSYWEFPSNKSLWPVIIDGWAIMYHESASRGQTTCS